VLTIREYTIIRLHDSAGTWQGLCERTEIHTWLLLLPRSPRPFELEYSFVLGVPTLQMYHGTPLLKYSTARGLEGGVQSTTSIVVVGLGKPTELKLRVDLRFGFMTNDEGQLPPKRSEEPRRAMGFAYALHMFQQNFVPFPCLYIEFFELVIEIYV